MVLIHNGVYLMGEDDLWDPGEDLGKQKGLFFICNKLFVHPKALTLPRQGFFQPLTAIQWLFKRSKSC